MGWKCLNKTTSREKRILEGGILEQDDNYTRLLVTFIVTGNLIVNTFFKEKSLIYKVRKNYEAKEQDCYLFVNYASYLFNDDDIYFAIGTETIILGLKANNSWELIKWIVLMSSPKSSSNTSTLLTIPPKSDHANVKDKEAKAVYFSDFYPISETEIFYRVLESETHLPSNCGIVNLKTKAVIELDNRITSVRNDFSVSVK